MCNKALAPLKFIPDQLVTCKMSKELYTALYADENMLYYNEDSVNVVFSCNQMGIFNKDLNNIDLSNNFDEDFRDTNIFIKLLGQHIKFEKRKAFKKDK